MATPMYHTASGARYRRRSAVSPSGQRSGVVARIGSWFGRDTPPYSGAGQPAPGTGGSLLGCGGTPTYASAPSLVTEETSGPVRTQASTQAAPQGQPIAIVVPRS
jgi:hypothetical protein